MRAALLSSCPQIGATFGMLGEHLGHGDKDHHRRWNKCVPAEDPFKLASEVRQLISGSHKVVVGISKSDPKGTMRTLHYASRSHECAVIMTLEGYRAFMDYIVELNAAERDFFLGRIRVVITAGDFEDCFTGLEALMPRAERRHFGGTTWSPETCKEIAELIRGKPT